MGLFTLIDDIRSFWSYICYGQFGEPDPKEVFAEAKKDKLTTNLYVGKIIEDSSMRVKVVAHHRRNNIHVLIEKIKDSHFESYLDVGKIYPVYRHRNMLKGEHMQVWEISPKRMKRDTSQMLLFWEIGHGWSWEIDC